MPFPLRVVSSVQGELSGALDLAQYLVGAEGEPEVLTPHSLECRPPTRPPSSVVVSGNTHVSISRHPLWDA